MELHCGLDLHSNNTYAGVIDQSGKRVVRTKLKNNPAPDNPDRTMYVEAPELVRYVHDYIN